jgi:hypothetical protein
LRRRKRRRRRRRRGRRRRRRKKKEKKFYSSIYNTESLDKIENVSLQNLQGFTVVFDRRKYF